VQSKLPQQGEVVGGVIGAGAHMIVGKDDIRAPRQAVRDAPAHVDRLIDALHVGCDARVVSFAFAAVARCRKTNPRLRGKHADQMQRSGIRFP